MICFEGKVSKEVRSFARKKAFRALLPIYIPFFLIGIICTILMIVENRLDVLKFAVAIASVLVGIFGLLLPILSLESIEPQKVEIEDGFIECFFVNGTSQTKSVDKVKRVTDRGNFYEIDFYFPPRMVTCICQKDLLVEGTLEEFEELFKDKLVQKPD